MCSSTIKQIIAQRVADALIAYKVNQKSNARTNDGASGSAGGVRHTDRESVFRIYSCTENCQVKYATCTLLDGALTWWNAYAQFIGLDVAYETSWKKLKKMMTKEYCPRNELQKMEIEFWNLSL
ncbi:reverse transcriptase domain-containing protein, partial [Tanacetum coccineum]